MAEGMERYAVVSGASGEIGSAIADELARCGFRLALIYRNNSAAAERLALKYPDCRAYRCDLTDEAAVAAAGERILSDFGSVDLIVNCAGISKVGLITDFSGADFDEIFSANIKSMFLLNNAFLPHMIAKKAGSIINISSMWGEVGASCEVLYSASKAAVIGYTKSLAKELGPSGIRVNCVSPGFIDTAMNDHLTDCEKADFAQDTPLCRLGAAADVARAVRFLATDESGFITGQTLGVNGGFVM